MQWIRSHLSFANVISMIALFVALGGTTYAAVQLPKNSVGSKQIKKRAVRGKHINRNAVSANKIQDNAISSPKIADGTVFSADLGDNSVGSGKVIDGSLQEVDLAPGLLDINVTVQFTQAADDLANGAETSVDAQCLPGQIALGGGTRGDLTNSELTKITASRPIISDSNSGAPADDGTFTGWRGTFVNENNGAGIRPEVWVICAG